MSERIETEVTESNGKLFEQVEIEGTPFTAIKLEDNWFLTMGKYRLTETLESLEACIEESKDASWFRIMQIVNIMIKEDKEEEMRKTIEHLEAENSPKFQPKI